MHAGLIPILSYQTSVDVGDGGFILRENSIEEICNAVRGLAEKPISDLQGLAREAWTLARRQHTREIFAKEFSSFVDSVLMTG
jgi:hypothetical protein